MDSFPKCHVCQQLFTQKGPAPYLLPCLHAVCETCVTSTSSGVISCSSCQTQVNLTETHLQKDAVRQREIFHLTVQHRPSELLCTHEDDGNQAVCWCQDCEEFLCEHCQNIHESFKAYRKHSVQNIGDIQPGSLECEEYCNIHPKFILEYRDKVCNIQICNRCRRSDHAEHDVEDIDVAADLARTEMGGQLKEVQEAVSRHTSYLEVTKQQIQSTEETSQTLENQITATFSSLKTLLVQREKELLIALEQHKEKTKSILGLQTEVFQSKYKKCKTTSEYIHKTLLYCSKYDLLNLRNQLGETTRDCLASTHASEAEDFPATVFSIEGLEKLKKWMTSFGAIGPVTDLSTSRSLKKDIATQVEIEQFSEVEDQYKQETSFLEAQLRQQGIYLLKPGSVDKAFLLQCTQLKFDCDKININKVHVNTDGALVNKKGSKHYGDSKDRLIKYEGTSNTVPLPRCGSPQYWEVKGRVNIDKALIKTWLLLETGLCREAERDQSHCIDDHPQSYSLTVVHCTKHSSICRMVRRQGKYVLCLPDTLPNTPGQSVTLHYGVVFDDAKCRVAFLDVNENTVISTLKDVDCSRPLWPMFGVHNPDWASVSMSLVVGTDIVMSEKKQELILEALS